MKKLTAVFLCFLLSSCAQVEAWRLTSVPWEPYTGPEMPTDGKTTFKVSELLAPYGVELDVEYHNWGKAKELSREEEYLGYYPAWPSGVIEGFVSSLPIDNSFLSALSRKEEQVQWKSYEDMFSSSKVGVIGSYIYPDEIQKWITKYPENTLKIINEEALAAALLLEKRVDYVVTDPNVLAYYAKKFGQTQQIENHYLSMFSIPLVIALRVSPENKKKIELLNKALASPQMYQVEEGSE